MELAILIKLCIVICMCNFVMVAIYVYVQVPNGCSLLCMNGWNYICMYDENYVLLNSSVKYIYICHIYLLWKLLDLKKQKKSQYAGSLPSATDGNGLFANSRRWQMRHVAANCASWELTHLVSLPTVADGKGRTNFAVSGGRQSPAISHLTD